MPIDLIIFDCDGTLVDSELSNARATSAALKHVGLTQYDAERARNDFMGMGQKHIFEKIERDNGIVLPSSVMKAFIEYDDSLMDEGLQAAPGIREVLDYCHTRFKICVASNGQTIKVEDSLTRTGLRPYFADNAVFTAAMVKNPKPAPDLFLHAAFVMGAPAENTLVLEDSLIGLRAGLLAGMTTIGYVGLNPDQETQRRDMLQAGARCVIKDHREFIKIINEQDEDHERNKDQGLRS